MIGFHLILLLFTVCFGLGWICWDILGSRAWNVLGFLVVMFMLGCLGSIEFKANENKGDDKL
jgi:hypothetical protein